MSRSISFAQTLKCPENPYDGHLGWRTGAKAVGPALREVSTTQGIDRANYLQTLRRELANLLIWHDPQRYLQLYREIHADVKSLTSWRLEEVRKRLNELCRKYPNYNDFDVLATREYVLYADSPFASNDQLEERYRDLIMFATLSSVADESWKRLFVKTTSDKELAHLSEYVQRIEDTKLRLRLERAMDDHAMRHYDADEARVFDNDLYTIRPLPHFAENRYGVHLKRTNEFGIHSFVAFDDGRISDSYYRSDPTFQHEQPLDPLHGVMHQMQLPR